MNDTGFDKWWELVSLDDETTKEHAREYYRLATQELEAKLQVAVEIIGDCVKFIEDERSHSGSTENNGRTNHFFMMNAAKMTSIEKIKAK